MIPSPLDRRQGDPGLMIGDAKSMSIGALVSYPIPPAERQFG